MKHFAFIKLCKAKWLYGENKRNISPLRMKRPHPPHLIGACVCHAHFYSDLSTYARHLPSLAITAHTQCLLGRLAQQWTASHGPAFLTQ